jgi:hypothetical protein
MTATLAETTDPETPDAPLPVPAIAPDPGTAPAPDASPDEPEPGGPEDRDDPDVPDDPEEKDEGDGDDGPDDDEPEEAPEPEPEAPEAKAARLSADADRWTAEAMTAPPGDPLGYDEARALVSAPAGGAVLGEKAWQSYLKCQPVAEAECKALTAQWATDAALNVMHGIKAWNAEGRPESGAGDEDTAPDEADADWAAARARVLGPLDEARRVLHAA